MTAEVSSNVERRFARDTLPWVVGAAALVVYLVTLNHWVTLSNLQLVTRVNGWNWQPPIIQPLLVLLTYPFRWLPAAWVPLALNIFTAICASLTLGTLARSVALLPHDRVEQQRLLVQNERALLPIPDAWVPIILAAVALGLQLTFWENAIAASGEMLDLLVFAYIIRCLLEHRLDERPAWLDRAAFLFGAGMANNWGLVPFLPLFLLALVRTKRLRFFSLRTIRRIDRSGWERAKPALHTDLRWFLRMTLLGLAGLSLVLVLPLLQVFSPDSALSFWQALKAVAGSYWTTLYMLARVFWRNYRDVALLLAAASLLPVLLMSIRWGAFGGGQSHAKFDLAAFISHLAHAFLLLVCLWTVFDPPISPRQVARHCGFPFPFLPLYYLTALSIGYYSGFFLLLFGAAALQRTSRRRIIERILCRVVPLLVYVLLGLVLVGLLLENVPVIRAGNAASLDQYARLAAASLPPENALVLSDDSARLAVLRAELAREGKAKPYLPVETRLLPAAPYRAWLSREYPGRWPAPETEANPLMAGLATSPAERPLDPPGVVRLIYSLGQSNHVYCLQLGVSPLLEEFYLQPHGLLQQMRIYSPDYLAAPPLKEAEMAENQAFWQRAIETSVRPLLQLVAAPELPRPALEKLLMKKAHLQTPPPTQAKVLARWYSGALSRWGVTLQRNGRLSDAASCFALARELDPDNLPARVNWQCNSNLLARQTMTVDRAQSFQEQLGKYRNLNPILTEYGPFDDPSYCYQLGLGFAVGGMPRQACQEFGRVTELVPNDLPVRLIVGDLYNQNGQAGRALQIAAEIRANPNLRPLDRTNKIELACLEARTWLSVTNRYMAQAIINALLFDYPRDSLVAQKAASVFAAYGDYSDALKTINRVLEFSPDNPTALTQKGSFCALRGDFSNAIPPLTLSLSLTNTYPARATRAYAYMESGRLNEAEADYKELLSAFPEAYQTYNGLGELALRQKDTNAAIRYYEQFIAKVGADSREARFVAARLKSLQPNRP